MAETKIEWADYTFNPWMGCTKVSPACAHCYAERDFDHRYNKVQWGPSGTRVLTSDANWKKPLKWNSEAAENGVRYRVFCASLADVFEDWHGPIYNSSGRELWIDGRGPFVRGENYQGDGRLLTMDDVRRRLFELIDATPNLDWLILTKRPENIRRMWIDEKKPWRATGKWHRDNVWLGTSVENQEYADQRIPELLKCRDLSPVLFLSCEPLLGPVEFSNVTKRSDAIQQLGKRALDGIDWVIAGGESGPDARPSNPAWFRSLRDQCTAAKVPFHFKQWGEFGPDETATPVQKNNAVYEVCEHGERVYRVGKNNAGRVLDGELHDGLPRVSE